MGIKFQRHRLIEYDIMKGVLIFLVVWGHAVSPDLPIKHLIYWFHMPVFFMLTGALSNWNQPLKLFLNKRIKSYVIPYFSWMFLLIPIGKYVFGNDILDSLYRMILGGVNLTTSFSFPFWFINSLFLSSVAYKIIYSLKWRPLFVSIIYLFFLLLSLRFKIPNLVWSLGTVPYVVFYFELGVQMKKVTGIKYIYVLCFVSLILIFLGNHSLLYFSTDMKYSVYPNFLYCFLIPCLSYICLLKICQVISQNNGISNILSQIGLASLIIMYIHPIIINGLKTNYMIKTIISILFGVLLYRFLIKTPFFSVMFTGSNRQ